MRAVTNKGFDINKGSKIMCTLVELAKEEISEKIKSGDTLTAWRQASELLEYIKAQEMALRKELVEKNFAESTVGKNKAKVDGGELIFTKSYTTKVVESTFDEVARELDENFVNVAELFKVSHTLSKKAYDMLTDDEKKIVDKTLEVKESAPKLEFKASVLD